MFFGLHTTTKEERDLLIGQPGEDIRIDPRDFHGFRANRAIVTEEGTGKLYEHSTAEFFEILEMLRTGKDYRYEDTAYYKRYAYKGTEIHTRLANLPKLFHDIRMNGVQTPVHCEATGERLDGSYRTKIASFLGYAQIPAVLHRFHWKQISENFIERKLAARWLSGGKEYYEFSYGYKDWRNIPDGGHVYRENAEEERAALILSLIRGEKVLDVGCNEGYIAIQAALAGHRVEGVDIDYTHGANLNKLIFEFVKQRDLPVEFSQQDIGSAETINPDTVLFLNVLYHIQQPVRVLKKFLGRRIIVQCNMRKAHERRAYYGSHPDDARDLLIAAGFSIKQEIQWRDKPIIVAV